LARINQLAKTVELGSGIRVAVLVLAFGISMPACTVEARKSDNTHSGDSAQSSYEIIPVEIYDNLVFLQVRVNGSAPHSFLLDTGANTSFLNESLARSLSLGPKRTFEAKVGTGETSTRLGVAGHVELSFGDVELPAAKMLVTDLAQLESRIGHEIGGIVGADVFKHYVVTIDYGAQTVALSNPRTFSYQGRGEVLPIRIVGDRPFLKARVTPIGANALETELVIDTGDTSALGFHTPFVIKHDLRASTKTLAHLSKGLSGDSRNWRGRVRSLQLGGIVIDHPLATFSEATRGSEAESKYDGLIGGEILRRFRVIFDYAGRTMIVEPNPAFFEQYDTDMSGLTLSEAGADFRSVTVDGMDADSAAAEAGINVGDVIETIDSQSTASMTLDEVRRLLKQDGAELVLGVRRGMDVTQLTILLHRLI
jgi:hypothetical protein